MTPTRFRKVTATCKDFAYSQNSQFVQYVGLSSMLLVLKTSIKHILCGMILVIISGCGIHYADKVQLLDITQADNKEVKTKVYASASEWRNSGVMLRKGIKYKISATGRWSAGPSCGVTSADGLGNSFLCPDNVGTLAGHMTGSGTLLVGKIGEQGEPFAVGNGLELTAEEDGVLFLVMNGGIKIFCSGYVNVTTAVLSPPVLNTPVQQAYLLRKSDVDELRAGKAKPNKNAYAIVIGIEQYRQKLPKADFAVADARMVTEYLIKLMGYPEENIVTLTNEYASKSDFEKYFERWLLNNTDKDSSIFVYYSGHGAPDPRTGGAYLVPYDGDPAFIVETGYSLKRMYDALGKLPAKEIIVALDSCFSGAGGRSVIAKGARPLVMNLQNNVALSKSITIMAAASGDQFSSTYDEKGHGLFTYYMLKGIKDEDVIKQDGSIAISDLFSYLKPQVERIARRQYNNEQTPQLIEPKGK
jgi:Caspase domain